MTKSIFVLALLSGIGYVLSLAFSFSMIRLSAAETVRLIGLSESVVLTISSILYFGVQGDAARKIVFADDWKSPFQAAQKAKLTLAVVISMVGVALYLADQKIVYLLLILSPLLTFNTDYALYALGKPIMAGFVSLFRNGLPYLVLLCMLFLGADFINETIFIVLISSFSVIAGHIGSRHLGTNMIQGVGVDSLLLYFNTLRVGAGSFLVEYIRPLAMLLGLSILKGDDAAAFYFVIKLYIVYIGVRRLIVSALYKKISEPESAKLVDRNFMLVGGATAALLIIFSQPAANLISSQNASTDFTYIVLLGLCVFSSSIFLTSGPWVQFLKLDTQFLMSGCVSFFSFLILSAILMSVWFDGRSILLALISAELISAIFLRFIVRRHWSNLKSVVP